MCNLSNVLSYIPFRFSKPYTYIKGFPGGSEVKASACNVGDPGSIPGLGSSPGEGNGIHCDILAWKIPLTEETGGLHSKGSHEESDTTE